MNNKALGVCLLLFSLSLLLVLGGCAAHADPAAEAPPPRQGDSGRRRYFLRGGNPEQYPLVTATEYKAPSELVVAGVVLPDISRSVPVTTLGLWPSRRHSRPPRRHVQKGQVLLRVRSDDVGGGFDAYRKAVTDELLARKQLDRAKDLYDARRDASQDFEVAQDTEDDAKTTLDTATEHLRLLGNDPTGPMASWTSWRPSRA